MSREHHQVLLLAFKIRQGLKNDINLESIYTYCNWFFESFLQPHFKKEQAILSQVIDKNSDLFLALEKGHQQLSESFQRLSKTTSGLKKLEEQVMATTRSEERFIFEDLQAKLSKQDVDYLETHLKETHFSENLELVFWM